MGAIWLGGGSGAGDRLRSAEDARGPRLCGNCSGRGREWVRSKRPHLLQSCKSVILVYKKLFLIGLTTFPGLRLERRQVEVSVVQQLKQRRRTRSLSFVAASSVYMMETLLPPGMGYGRAKGSRTGLRVGILGMGRWLW